MASLVTNHLSPAPSITPIQEIEDSGAKLTLEKNPADVLPWLPCTVSVDIPLSRFTIHDLTKLTIGTVVSTAFHHNSDLPLYVNGQLIGWTEFEVIDDRLAVRITEIA